MGFKGLTVNTDPTAEPHIYAEDDASIYQSILGSDGVLNIGQKFEATVLSNNLVRMADGILCVNGHIGRTAYGLYDDFEIANGQSGVNRNDLIIAKFQTTGTNGIDTYTVEVKQGAAAAEAVDPEITQEDLYQGGKLREYPLYRVRIEGLSIVAVEPLFKIIPTVPELEARIGELNSEIDSVKTPTFSTASSRANIVSGESNSTLFGKIAKWFSDLKAAAFCAVANNLTTAASGYVLDARQGKELLTKMTAGLTRMTATTPGKIILPNGAIIVYGFAPFEKFTADSDIGGYSYIIPLSSYGLYSVTNCIITPCYANGVPKVALNHSDNSKIKIGVDVKLTTGGIYWMVIG